LPEISSTEENYLKAIFKIIEAKTDSNFAATGEIANSINASSASVTDMLKRLFSKDLIIYKPYYGAKLNEEGEKIATLLVRKHRLWEVFLVDKLKFSWSEVHPIAEQLEHIKSNELINRLDDFLDYPQTDPHGDPIPDKDGNITEIEEILLSELKEGENGLVVGVKIHTKQFLDYLDSLKLILGSNIKVVEIFSFDSSMMIKVNDSESIQVSDKVSANLYVKKQ